ncbi:hypothetical protein [Streptomyces sp. NPDC057552]
MTSRRSGRCIGSQAVTVTHAGEGSQPGMIMGRVVPYAWLRSSAVAPHV